jgi:hypothetical protein
LNFAGILVAALLWQYVWHTAGDIFYPLVVGAAVTREAQSAGPEGNASTLSLGASLAVLAIWVAALVGAAIWRVQRSEY